MSKKFYISDLHIDHANVLGFDNRPFKDVEEMNNELIRRWNDMVSDGDLVYILGDMFWCSPKKAMPIMEQLNGQKILVKGNHDRWHDSRFDKMFAKIDEYIETEDNGRKIVLCHYPIPCFKNHFYGWTHLYGHVHNSFEWNMMEHQRFLMEELYTRQCNMINVGAMMPYMDYTPRTLDEIERGYALWRTFKAGETGGVL
jgi:calcineurin-like phosphoesterase family protein